MTDPTKRNRTRRACGMLVCVFAAHLSPSLAFAQAESAESPAGRQTTETSTPDRGSPPLRYEQEWTPLAPSTAEAIIANVGGQILLLSDLQRVVVISSRGGATLTAAGQIKGSGIRAEEVEALFEKLIDQSILDIKVKELGIEVTESELDAEIDRFLQGRGISREDFLQMLRREGETELSHRSEFKRQLESQRLIGRVIRPLVSVTDEEVRSFYLANKRSTKNPSQDQARSAPPAARFVLRSLLINGLQTDPQAKLKLDSIAQGLASGSSFRDLVRTYSEASDAQVTEGLLDPRPLEELPEALRGELESAQPGAILGPLEIGSSTFYFEFVSTTSASAAADSPEFNLEEWRQKLLETKFAERLESYLKAERNKVRVVKRPMTFR